MARYFRASNLSFAYPQNGGQFRFPDVEMARGEQLLVIGQSGSGKTTLLHLVAGILRPQCGKIVINGTDITQLSSSGADKFRGRNIGIVFQRPHFVKGLTVAENLLLAQYMANEPQQAQKMRRLLQSLQMEHKQNAQAHNLSTGERQRIGIARALMNEPGIILADEPTSNLDDHNCDKVMQLLATHARQANATLMIATHDHRIKQHIKRHLQL